MQVEMGASGITVATVWEAAAMARAGIRDILVANEIVGDEKTEVLAHVAQVARLTVAVDSHVHVDALARAAQAAESEIGIVIEVEVGAGRCGVEDSDGAARLASYTRKQSCLRLDGVMGYEGHCMLIEDKTRREQETERAVTRLIEASREIENAGFAVDTVSAGGTGTFELVASFPEVTEVRPGSYALMDRSYERAGAEFSQAVTVLATVISRRREAVVLDCGIKAIAIKLGTPAILGHNGDAVYLAEEHLAVRVDDSSSFSVGDQVELCPEECGPTTNLHDVYHVLEDDLVVDVWPVLARGPGRSHR
jgi:3-hydroxy-D-aspartate aldolase